MKLYRNWIINEVARAGEHTNERTYVLTYIRTGQTLYPLHNFVVRGDNNYAKKAGGATVVNLCTSSVMLYISTKFSEIISNGIKVIELYSGHDFFTEYYKGE